jgi:hypothetical protein
MVMARLSLSVEPWKTSQLSHWQGEGKLFCTKSVSSLFITWSGFYAVSIVETSQTTKNRLGFLKIPLMCSSKPDGLEMSTGY